MGQMQSDLSSPKYGYDFVVATTQESINATMKEYLSGVAEPEVIMCYVMDTTGNPQVIDYKALVRLANNTDPFSVPNRANPATDEGVQNLAGAYFMYGIKAKIGLPPGIPPQRLPDIVNLGADTSSIIYNLMCLEFTVVEATYGRRGIVSWLNQIAASGDCMAVHLKGRSALVRSRQERV